jgi:hypothetical protein
MTDNSGSTTEQGTGSGTDAGAGAGAAGAGAAGAGGGGGDAGAAGAGSGQAAAKWWESLSDANLKTSPNISRYDTVEAAAKALDEATKRLGVPPDQLLRLPTKPDDAAAYEEIYKKLGRPDKAEDYGVKFADDASDEAKAVGGKLIETAHKIGLNKAQLAPLVELLNGETAAAAKAEADHAAAEAAATQAALKAEWGPKFSTYEKEIPKLLADLGGKEGKDGKLIPATGAEFQALLDDMNARGLGNSLPLNRLLARICDMRAEPGKMPGAGEADRGREDSRGMTPVQATAALRAFEADKSKTDALMDRSNPQHKAMVEERDRLARMAAGQTV